MHVAHGLHQEAGSHCTDGKITRNSKSKDFGAHRWYFERIHGPVAPDMDIDHFVCSQRSCVNPAHLRAVTRRENILRSPIAAAAINARLNSCRRGHPFTHENTRWDRDRGGKPHRRCKACERERTKKRATHRAVTKSADPSGHSAPTAGGAR